MNTKYAGAYGDRGKKNDFYNGLTLYDSMFMNSSLKTTHSLSPKEYALLRALAVGLSETETCKIPQGILLDYNAENYPVPQIFLPNKKGDEVPVYKVRMREKYSNAIQLKPKINGFAVPRNNHHITISMDNEGAFHEEVVTFWEAAQRYRHGLSVYKMLSKNEGQIITHLHINDLFLMGIEEEEEDFQYLPKTQISRHLYRVQKLSSNYYEFRIAYKQINSETQFPEYIRINNFGHRKTGWNSYKPIKVALTATGNLIL